MRISIAILLLSIVSYCNAQKNIEGMTGAEKSFAAFSELHGTREAFLNFLDSNAVVFENGQAVNGIKLWRQRQNTQGLLKWQPQLAEIAASNDFGYTTGPWTFKTRPSDDSITAGGQFITVWHMDSMNNWKVLIDLGVTNNTKNTDLPGVSLISPAKATGRSTLKEMLKSEEQFIGYWHKTGLDAYRRCLSEQSVLNRDHYSPAFTANEKQELIKKTPIEITYTIKGYGTATSGDLGYVYGTLIFQQKKGIYMRIWRREGDTWKISLEVIRY